MNRNKHADRPGYKRQNRDGDKTRNSTNFRITASWDKRPDRPAIRTTTDKRARDRIARAFAAQGAYVVVEKHRGHEEWRTLYELDGPAEAAAERTARRRALTEQREQPAPLDLDDAAEPATADDEARAHDHTRRVAERLAARGLMTPPSHYRSDRAARHITGAQR